MVDDPIALTHHPDNAFFIRARRQGKKEVFATIINRDIRAIYLFDASLSGKANYHIKFVGDILSGSFWANGRIDAHNMISREKFFDIIKKDYPNYFEWFLFHPEWL